MMGRVRGLLLVAVGVSLLGGVLAAPAGAFVYWANQTGTTIGRANLDGSEVDHSFITGANGPCGVAVSDTHIYWANQSGNAIGRANLNGSGANQTFITGANIPCGVAVNDTHIYWANDASGGTGTVGRANIDGSEPDQDILDVDTDTPCGVGVDDEHLYWTELFGGVGRADLDGANAEAPFITATGTCGVTANDGHIFWTSRSDGIIGRANLDGTLPAPFFDGGEDSRGVAVNGTHIYWADNALGRIGRANLDGTGVDQDFIIGVNVPSGVAIDSGFAPPPPPPPPPPASEDEDTEAPQTTIDSGPKRKVKSKKRRKKVSFAFSSESGASFECSPDGEPFAACTSPHTEKVKKGRHEFAIRARDAAGNVDQSPAERSFKVKKKRRR